MNLKSAYYFLLGVLVFFSSLDGNAQRKRPQEQFESFMKQQWLIGVNFGTNLTQAVPQEDFYGISTLSNPEDYEKSYNDFSLPGIHAGINIAYYYNGISIGIMPNARRMRFSYEYTYSWEGTLPTETVEYDYEIEQRLDYFEVPLTVRYDILKKKFKPFVSGGVFYALSMGASKKVTLTETDYATGEAVSVDGGTVFIGVNDSFNRHVYGFMGGIGIGYDSDNNVRMALEFNYRQTFGNIINPSERYTENQLTSVGDVYDDMYLRNVSVNIQFLFPLKYISPQFKSI